jgi:hypothetical protein
MSRKNGQSARMRRRLSVVLAILATSLVAATSAPAAQVQPAASLCKQGYYKNVDGRCVKSPTHSSSVPAGATAKCRDGSYSFSQHASGTCSHHGGVAVWIHHP